GTCAHGRQLKHSVRPGCACVRALVRSSLRLCDSPESLCARPDHLCARPTTCACVPAFCAAVRPLVRAELHLCARQTTCAELWHGKWAGHTARCRLIPPPLAGMSSERKANPPRRVRSLCIVLWPNFCADARPWKANPPLVCSAWTSCVQSPSASFSRVTPCSFSQKRAKVSCANYKAWVCSPGFLESNSSSCSVGFSSAASSSPISSALPPVLPCASFGFVAGSALFQITTCSS